jgi:catalase
MKANMADTSNEQSPLHPLKPGSMRFIGRLLPVLIILAGVMGLFAYTGGWLSLHRLTPTRMIDRFEQVNGVHPGFRRNHAKGVCFSGYFDSNGQGVALSKAAVFQTGRCPVIGRFALAIGQPVQTDTPQTVRSMAIQITQPDGQQWRSGMNNIPVFAVSTPQAFYEFILAGAADPKTGKPDGEKMGAFFARHPESAKAIGLIRSSPFSSGFENSTYNSLDAFRFINAAGDVASVRWSMLPTQPFAPIAATQPAQTDPNFLFDELIATVRQHSLQWRLMVTVAQAGDPTNDATLPWPPDRRQIDAGTVTIDRIESEDVSPARDINFDPLVLPNGIAGSDDPLLSARSAAYAESFTRREGETKTPSQVSTSTVVK